MPWFVTPGQLSQRAEFYHQLSSMMSAGLGLLAALETLSRSGVARSFNLPLRAIISGLEQGSSVTDAIVASRGAFADFDVALVQAGELSGRLVECFRMLSDYYAERARLLRHLFSDLAYPLFILHFAVLVFPPTLLTQLFVGGGVTAFVIQKMTVLAPLYGAAALLVLACQGQHGEHWRSLLESLFHRVPLLGQARRELALARLSAALEALINAGVSIFDAWDIAAAASGSPALKRRVAAWKPQLQSGTTPAELLRHSPEFPNLFASLYHTGEISGDLDNSLRRLGALYQEEGSRRMRALAQWVPRLIYILILFVVGYKIIQFWSGYFGQQREFLDL